MQINVSDISREQAGELYPTLLTPRPVVLIGTYDAQAGRSNLAPYSSVSFVANNPPMLVVSFSRSRRSGGGQKDTLNLARESHELVVNMLTRDQANIAVRAAETPPEPAQDDYERLELKRAAFSPFACGRIAGSPAALGCRVTAIHPLEPSSCTLLIAQVEILYVSESWLSHAGRAARKEGLFASIAAEYYVNIADADEFYLPRTWD